MCISTFNSGAEAVVEGFGEARESLERERMAEKVSLQGVRRQ